MYNEDYYKTNNYKDYLIRGEGPHYKIMAEEITCLLKKLCRPHDTILDFGCAVGFFMQAVAPFAKTVDGVDLSKWARGECKKKGFSVTEEVMWEREYDVVYGLDVLEHLPEDELVNFFENIKAKTIVYKIPVCNETEGKYVLECAEVDPTHLIRWTKTDWRKFFEYYGYYCLDVNLDKIYSSEGGFCGIAIKQT